MQKLQCEICGGSLLMQSGGKVAICDSCGLRYSAERMRERIMEIRGAVQIEGEVQARQTGTASDVTQWRTLVKKYYAAGDFSAAENIVKKILEALPQDEEANRQYEELQDLKYMEIRNGVLVKYNGRAKTVIVPVAVQEIGEKAFWQLDVQKVVLPDELHTIGSLAFGGCSGLREIKLPKELKAIGESAFSGCSGLREIKFPEGLEMIGPDAFGCSGLQEIKLPEGLEIIGPGAFNGCRELKEVKIPYSVKEVGKMAFWNCSKLERYTAPKEFEDANFVTGCPWSLRREQWREKGLCLHCGGKIALISGRCKQCGRKQDL